MRMIYRNLMKDDDIDIKVMKSHEAYPKHGPDTASLPITVKYVNNHTRDMLNIGRLIEDQSYYASLRKSPRHLLRFMRHVLADYVGDSFQQVVMLKQNENDYV